MFKSTLLLAIGLLAIVLQQSIAQTVICGEGQEPRQCGCDLSCSTLDAACRGICTEYERCFCKDGYVRLTDEESSICVPRDRCSVQTSCRYCDPAQSLRCEREKIWVKCSAETEPKCCGCDTQCKDPNCEPKCFDSPQCLCKPGFVRDGPSGMCIPVEKCGVDCRELLPMKKCLDGSEPQCEGCEGSCENLECNRTSFLQPMCLCPPGLVRMDPNDPYSPCIKPEECREYCYKAVQSYICPTGEVPSCDGCDGSCDRPDCEPQAFMSPKCLCPSGYVRENPNDPASQCIPREKCTNQGSCANCDPDLVLKCERAMSWVKCTAETEPKCCGCDTTCREPNCDLQCFGSPQCLCKPGYVRDGPNYLCIPIEKCDGNCTSQLPLVGACLNGAIPSCEGCDGTCERPDCLPRAFLNPQCLCPPGYVRQNPNDPNSQCISRKDCNCKSQLPLIKCANGAVPSCEGCDGTCERPDCLPQAFLSPRCLCPPGYVRQNPNDPNSQCVPKENCGCKSQLPLIKCANGAIPSCEGCDGTCERPDCFPKAFLSPRCLCPPGYVRQNPSDPNSQCIPKEKCDCKSQIPLILCGSGAIPSCEGCDGSCANPKCLPVAYLAPRCLCPPGQVRIDANDPNSQCVPIEDCKKDCKSQLPFTMCSNGAIPSCEGCDGTCERPECFPAAYLQPQCFCPPGYVRQNPSDPNSQCIPKKKCDCKSQIPLILCGSGAIPSCEGCDGSCERPKCLPVAYLSPRCLCPPGQVRIDANDPNSQCVNIEDCRKDCRSQLPYTICSNGAVPSCEGCDGNCDNPKCFPAAYLQPQCFCPPGQVRQFSFDPNSQCIPVENCTKDCKSLIPATSCPANGGVPTCLGCEGSCEQPKCTPVSFLIPQCLCPSGFLRLIANDPTSPCVKPLECKPNNCESLIPATSCPVNGGVPTCLGCEGSCSNWECKPRSYITPQCLCPSGWLRLIENDPTSPCVTPRGCGSNSCELQLPYTACPRGSIATCFGCEGTCKEPDCAPRSFKTPQCFCPSGMVRDENNRCVPREDCRSVTDICREKLFTAPPCTVAGREPSCFACDLSCEMAANGAQCLPALISDPQCFCKPGYLSLTNDQDSICIPKEDCFKKRCGCKQLKLKEKKCGCNEVAKCEGCDERCTPLVALPCQPEYYPEAKCFCKDGYLRFFDGECRPASECQLKG